MKWSFTPTQVIEGEVVYSLEDYIRDLLEEIKSKVSKKEFDQFQEGEERDKKYLKAVKDVFNFEYEINFMYALKKSYLSKIVKKADDEEKKIIKKTIKENKANMDMLHAILMKRIANELGKGLTIKQAIKATEEYSKNLISKLNYTT